MKTKKLTDDDKVDDYVAHELYDEDANKIKQLERLSAPWDMRKLFFGFSIFASDQADAEAKVVELRKKLRTDIARWKHWRQHPDLRARVDEHRARKMRETFDMPRIRDMRSKYEDYPLALLAGVAAHLLIGRNYNEAAWRAFELLDACSDCLSHVAYGKTSALEKALALPKYRTVALDKALREITGTDNATDATGYYREFLQKTRFKDMAEEEAAAASSKELEQRRKGKFAPSEIHCQRDEYLRVFPKRRPKQRKKQATKKAL